MSNVCYFNALTLDIEDYWSIFYRDWLGLDAEPSDAVLKNTDWFLQILDDRGIRATFFILGEVAQKFPRLVKQIAAQNHEIAAHGYDHRQVFKLSPEQFRQDVGRTKRLLEDLSGQPVRGHRAPAFSITPETAWAFDDLAEMGFAYDSSVFPVAQRRYGWPDFNPSIHKMTLSSGRTLIEAPLSTINILGKKIPAAGGGYIRHFPYFLTKYAVKKIQKSRPVIVYLHPYEIDAENRPFPTEHMTPAQKTRALRFHRLQLRNRHTAKIKIDNLLNQFRFSPLNHIIAQTLPSA